MSDTEQMTITEFLEARIAEDENEARDLQQETDFGLEAFGDYMLAECAAKRAIVAEHPQAKQDDRPQFANEPAECLTCYAMRDTGNGIENAKSPCPTLRAIADVYASHPDYQQEWAK